MSQFVNTKHLALPSPRRFVTDPPPPTSNLPSSPPSNAVPWVRQVTNTYRWLKVNRRSSERAIERSSDILSNFYNSFNASRIHKLKTIIWMRVTCDSKIWHLNASIIGTHIHIPIKLIKGNIHPTRVCKRSIMTFSWVKKKLDNWSGRFHFLKEGNITVYPATTVTIDCIRM